MCYLAVFSFFGFQHGFLDIFNDDLAAVTHEDIANHDLIFVDIHRIDEGNDQALRISDVRPVTFCNIGEVVEDLFSSNFFCTSSCSAMARLIFSNSSSLFLILAAMVGDAAPVSSAATRLSIAFSHCFLRDLSPSRIIVSFCACCHATRSAAMDLMVFSLNITSSVVSMTSFSSTSLRIAFSCRRWICLLCSCDVRSHSNCI